MIPFDYERTTDADSAVATLVARPLAHNAFTVSMAANTLVAFLRDLTTRQIR